MWIDNEIYVGRCRRNARKALRLIERRHASGAPVQPPSVATLIRQLRVRTFDLDLGDMSRVANVRARLIGAIGLATSQGFYDCATALADADKALQCARPDTVALALHLDQAATTLG